MFSADASLFLSRFQVLSWPSPVDFRALRGVFVARRDTPAASGGGWNRNQLSHSHQIVCRRREGKDPRHLLFDAMYDECGRLAMNFGLFLFQPDRGPRKSNDSETDVVEIIAVKALKNSADPQLPTMRPQHIHSKTVNFIRFQQTSING